jgi:transposase
MEPLIRRQYTADYKAQAVSLVESLGLAGAARKLGISSKTLANWVRLDRDGKSASSSSKRRAVSDIEAENSRLRAENATLRMEREVLKKATAFFAKESR